MRAPAVPLRHKLITLVAVGLLSCGILPLTALADGDGTVAGPLAGPGYEGDARSASADPSIEGAILAPSLAPNGTSIVSADVALDAAEPVVGSFTVDGLTYAVGPDGLTLVAVDAAAVPDGAIAIPASATYDGVTYDVTSIGPYAFYLSDATEAMLPASIAAVDGRAFRSSAVGSVSVDADNPNLASFDGCLYDSPLNSLLLIPEGRKGSVLLSCETEVVEASLFSHCSLVDAISVEEGGAAFSSWEGCLYDASGQTLLRVPAGATEITIKDGCTTIAAGALEGCAKLERITASASVASISPDVFTSIPTVSLPAASVSGDSQQVTGSQDADDSRVAPMLASGQAEAQPSSQDEASSGVASSLPDQGNASADSASQLTSMVALSTTDGDLPEVDASSITVVLPDDAPRALWEQVGFATEGGSDDEVAVEPLAESMISEEVELSGFEVEGEALSDGLPLAAFQSGSSYAAGTTTVHPNGGELWRYNESKNDFDYKGYESGVPTDSWSAFHIEGSHIYPSDTSMWWTAYYNGIYCTGWSRTANGGQGGDKLPNGYRFTATDGTIYACWPSVAVTFNKNNSDAGSTQGTTSTTCTVAQAMPGITKPTRPGYDFAGYYSATSGGTQYYDSDGLSARKWDKSTATTLYAQWTKKASYAVTLDRKGGSGGSSRVYYWPDKGYTSSSSSTTVLSSIPKPTLSGWTFSGYTDDMGTATYLYVNAGGTGTTRIISSDKTLYANWTKTVSLNANGGEEGSLTSLTAGIGRPFGQTCSQVASDNADYPIRSLFSKGITSNSDWAPTRAGYTFQGYYDTNASSGGTCYVNASGTAQSACNPVTSTMPSTLYARWSKNAIYAITLDSQLWASSSATTATASATSAGTTAIYYWVGKGWYNTASPSDTATAATTATALITQPTLAGYAYGGYWTGKAGTGTQKISGQKLSSTAAVSASVTWYAKWTKNAVHAITLDKNGGTGGTSAIYEWYGKGWYATSSPTVSSAAATSITAPTRAGYAYKGYATSSTATSGSYWTSASTMPSSTAFSAAKTLYAVWQKNAVSTVNLFKNAGDTTTLYKTVYLWYGKGWYGTSSPTDSTTALTTIGTPSWPGRTYKGFATSSTASAGSYWTTVTSFPSNTSSTFGSAAVGWTTNLYAVWQGNEVTLTWEPHNGSAATATKQTHSTTSTVKVALPAAPTWAGRTFAGWYTAETGGTQVTNATDLPASSATCHAHWTEDSYTISYDYDGGSVSGNPTTYKVTSATFTLKNPTKTGYTFTGWAGFLVDGAGRPIEPCLEGDGNMEVKVEKGSIGNRLYCATFKANRYTVEWYDFTGENLLITDEDIPYDMSGYEMPSRDDSAWLAEGHITPGYEIVGWANSPRQRTADYSFGATTGPLTSVDGATVKLYLAESPKVITISWVSLGEEFDRQGLTYSPDKKVPAQSLVPTNDPGWAFMGWWTAEEGGEQVTADTPLPTDSATFYAHWAPVVSAYVPIEVTARVDLLGLEEQAEASGYIESRCALPLKVAEVSFEPLSGAAELFEAHVADVFLEALAQGSASADLRFALDAAATEADAAKLAAFDMASYGTHVGIGYRFAIPDDVLAAIDQGRFEQVTTPIGQVAYTVALAG